MADGAAERLDFARAEETTEVTMTVADVVRALGHAGKFFIQFFLPEELAYEIPDFHIDSWDLLTAGDIMKVALALPRGHAKSTLTKLACLWHIIFTPIRFILYASNTSEIAAAAVVDIMNYMRSDNFNRLFGVPIMSTERDQQGFYIFEVNVPGTTVETTPDKWITKQVILKSIGTGKQVRGMLVDNQRPQLLVADDIEDEENTASDYLQKKVIRWIMGPFAKCVDRKYSKFIFIGNMLSNKCFLYQITLLDEWASRRMGCLKADGTPLWPDLWSLEKIREDFILYQKLGLVGLWFAEMMNMPVANENGLIAANDIRYRPIVNPGEQEAAFITVDPAISEQTWADKTAIVVHVLYNDVWQVAEYIEQRIQPDQTFWILIELCKKWKTKVVGIEMAAYQKVLKILFDVLMLVNNTVRFEIFEVPHRNRPKTERLVAFCSMMREGQWYLNEGDFGVTEQLLAYDPAKKNNTDDLIDACSMGPTMYNLYLPQILEAYDVTPANDQIVSGYALQRN
jgi:hypothetical protein